MQKHKQQQPHSRLMVFAAISNVQNRFNPCRVDFDYEFDAQGNIALERAEDKWLPLIPDLGIRWEFQRALRP